MPRFTKLPGEIRVAIVNRLLDYWRICDEDDDIFPYAAVCREWQAVIERYTFRDLKLNHLRMEEFGRIVTHNRRGCLERIHLHVELPEYQNDPCEERETWDDKVANNRLFTKTFQDLFAVLSEWGDDQVCRGGIHLFFSISSKSDLRNSAFDLWQRRRWNVKDIGEKRFADSYIDFVGQDEELNRTCLLKPVYAITSFETCPLIRRAILPAAYSDIISKLPRLREVSLELIKERRLLVRRAIFDLIAYYAPFSPDLGELLLRWSPSIESVTISANTLCSWRQLPHEAVSEADTGEKLCQQLRDFTVQLKQLRVSNLIRIREFLRPVWPYRGNEDDTGPFQRHTKLPIFTRMELFHISYGAIYYKPEWHKDSADINEHEDTIYFRQSISLAAARMAYNMPRLKEMVIAQRPMMWAGKHQLEYTVTEAEVKVIWTSTFDFKPWERTIDAWTEVARKHTGKTLKWDVVTLQGWQTDGSQPLTPALSF